MARLLGTVTLIFLSACATHSVPIVDPHPPGCEISVCLAGAWTLENGGNPDLLAMCEQLPGLVRDCRGRTCHAAFNMHRADQASDAVFAALDTDADKRLTHADGTCSVTVVGFSWGGIGAARAFDWTERDDIEPSRRVIDRLYLIEPFRWPRPQTVVIPNNVETAKVFRRSVVGDGDCSQRSLFGPYIGVAPTCDQAECTDVDFSRWGRTHFLLPNSEPVSGSRAGHCWAVNFSAPIILAEIHEQWMPDSVKDVLEASEL